MVSNIYKLYPQYQSTGERRQQGIPVAEERRSGGDRRPEQRFELSSNIKKDLNEVKTDFKETFSAFKDYEDIYNSVAKTNFISGVEVLKKQKEAQEREILNFVTSPIPMARRIINIKNNKDDDNPMKVVGLTAIAAINAKEDVRDLLSIVGKVKSQASQGYYAKYGFFVGTILEKPLKKSALGKRILYSFDNTIAESKIGRKLLYSMHVETISSTFAKEIKHVNGKIEKVCRKYVKLEGSKVGKLTALTFYRMPQLSLLAAGLLELPNIAKAKKKDKPKQAVNSTLNIVCIAVCGALLSASAAVFVPNYIGLPIMALGVGYYLGSKMARTIGFKINSNN